MDRAALACVLAAGVLAGCGGGGGAGGARGGATTPRTGAAPLGGGGAGTVPTTATVPTQPRRACSIGGGAQGVLFGIDARGRVLPGTRPAHPGGLICVVVLSQDRHAHRARIAGSVLRVPGPGDASALLTHVAPGRHVLEVDGRATRAVLVVR